MSTYAERMRRAASLAAGRAPLLVLANEGDGQALTLVTGPSGRLLLTAVDKESECAALALTPEAVELVRDALTEWLGGQR